MSFRQEFKFDYLSIKKVTVLLLSHFSRVRLCATPWTIQSMEFSRPEYWTWLLFPSPVMMNICHYACLLSSFSRVPLFSTPWTAALQAPLSMEFSRQEYWSGCYFLLQGILPTQGLNPGLLYCRQLLNHLSHQGSPRGSLMMTN